MTDPMDLSEPVPLDEARRREAKKTSVAPEPLDDIIIMPGNDIEESKDETIARLSRLDLIDYDQVREAEAKALGIRTTTLDKVVARASGDGGAEESIFAEINPASTQVDGAEMLEEISTIFTRHLILPTGAADAMALWVLHAHVHDTAEISPILALTSPTPECGKTTALNMVSALVPKPLAGSNITAAAVFRSIEKWRPTLLIDEADTFLRDND